MSKGNITFRSDLVLRDVQLKAVNKLNEDIEAGKQRLILSLPTGFGKSYVLLELMRVLVDNDKTVMLLTDKLEILQQYLVNINETPETIYPYRIDTVENYVNDKEANYDYDFLIFDSIHVFRDYEMIERFRMHEDAYVIVSDSLLTNFDSIKWFGKSFEISYQYTLKDGVDDLNYVPVYMHAPFDEAKQLLLRDQMLFHLENEIVDKETRTSLIVTSTAEEASEVRYQLNAINKYFSNIIIDAVNSTNSLKRIEENINTAEMIGAEKIIIGTVSQLFTLSVGSCRKLFILSNIDDTVEMNQLLAKCMRHAPGKRQLDIYDYTHSFYKNVQEHPQVYSFIQLTVGSNDIDLDSNIMMLTNRNPNMINDSLEHRDLLSMNREAKVFKHLIKQEGNTPLAIGIFGEWGSGKSFFLRTIQEELKQEKTTIFQIKFNAWHYSDTNLILSLSNHIFERLNMEVIKKTDNKAEVIEEHVSSLKSQKKSLQEFKAENDKQIKTLESDYEKQRNELLDESFDKIIEDVKSPMVKNAISLLKLHKDVKAYYKKSKKIRGRLKLFFMMKQNRNNFMLLLPVFILLLGPSFLELIEVVTIDSNIENLIRWIQFLGVALSSPVLHKAATNVTKVIDELDQFSEKQEALIKQRIGIESLKKKSNKLQTDINSIDSKIAQAQTGDYITYLLGERIHERNYHEHLGIIHHLRKDLELLSDYLLDDNNSTKINKIVLYIDDLDRCPADKVAQVLEAVHLLLSFKVFVVFVAADMKWISKCLYMNHGNKTMLTKATKESLLFAYDYMEKIFQLTYKPQALRGDTSVKFIDGLCGDLIEKEIYVPRETEKPVQSKSVEQKKYEPRTFDEHIMMPSLQSTPVTDQSIARDIKLSQEEINRLKDVLSLVNSTPRRLKRFMNTYQMIRASYETSKTTYEIMILLIMVIYYPDEQKHFVDNLKAGSKLSTYEYKIDKKTVKHNFLVAVAKPEFAGELAQDELLRWLPVVDRYSFFPCEE